MGKVASISKHLKIYGVDFLGWGGKLQLLQYCGKCRGIVKISCLVIPQTDNPFYFTKCKVIIMWHHYLKEKKLDEKNGWKTHDSKIFMIILGLCFFTMVVKKMALLMFKTPYSTFIIFMTLYNKSLENIVRKGENAGNQPFLLFHKVFYP